MKGILRKMRKEMKEESKSKDEKPEVARKKIQSDREGIIFPKVESRSIWAFSLSEVYENQVINLLVCVKTQN